jgi:GT2 family glycosyltransferase
VSEIYGGNVCFKRTVFDRYGLFDVRLGEGAAGRGEETELFRRMKESEIKTLYFPDVVVYHHLQKERLSKTFVLNRWYQTGYCLALLADNPKHRLWQIWKIRRKLLFRHLKRSLYSAMGNEIKRYKQEKRIHFYRGKLNALNSGRSHIAPDGDLTLSVCIITQNSQDQLKEALKSIESIADEIVVVDGGSSDNTKEIALSFDKVRYFYHPWHGDYASQKNYAMNKASGDWILVLDSDEVIGANMRRKIRRLIRSRKHDSYIFPRYWLIGREPPLYVESKKLYPDYQQRLFRNLPQYRYTDDRLIHHRFPLEVQGRGKKIKDTHIFHFDFIYHDRSAREKKVQDRVEVEPETDHINRNQYLFEDHPYKIKKCREKLG